MKKLLIAAAVIALAGSALAQTAHKVARVEDVTWVDDPLFKGAKTAILVGDPTKAEVIVLRMKIPPYYHIPPHTHPFAEEETVVQVQFMGPRGIAFVDPADDPRKK